MRLARPCPAGGFPGGGYGAGTEGSRRGAQDGEAKRRERRGTRRCSESPAHSANRARRRAGPAALATAGCLRRGFGTPPEQCGFAAVARVALSLSLGRRGRAVPASAGAATALIARIAPTVAPANLRLTSNALLHLPGCLSSLFADAPTLRG